MEFGIFSNGFRPHTTASQTYEEDLAEIVLADQLGYRDAYISEHHGEPVYIGKVDTLPVPELLMCKAAAWRRCSCPSNIGRPNRTAPVPSSI
jgi:hypothetical protein